MNVYYCPKCHNSELKVNNNFGTCPKCHQGYYLLDQEKDFPLVDKQGLYEEQLQKQKGYFKWVFFQGILRWLLLLGFLLSLFFYPIITLIDGKNYSVFDETRVLIQYIIQLIELKEFDFGALEKSFSVSLVLLVILLILFLISLVMFIKAIITFANFDKKYQQEFDKYFNGKYSALKKNAAFLIYKRLLSIITGICMAFLFIFPVGMSFLRTFVDVDSASLLYYYRKMNLEYFIYFIPMIIFSYILLEVLRKQGYAIKARFVLAKYRDALNNEEV